MALSLSHQMGAGTPSLYRLIAAAGFSVLLGGLFASPAQAVPSFSDQTGDPCTACHVGGFGPQLTAHGRQFKLSGYVDGTQARKLPLLSGMVEASFTKTDRKQDSAPAPGFDGNDNTAIDQASLFVAGRIYDRVGLFSQTTWDGVGHHWAWDNTDLRYGREAELAGVDTTFGVTFNNNPTVTDPYNTTPAWGFPYAASKLAPTPAAAPLLQGALAQRVIGPTAYALIDDKIYVEGGFYRALPGMTKHETLGVNLGVKATDGPIIDGTAPYWRLAYQDESPKSSLSVGTFGMQADVFPGGDRSSGTTDRYLDNGFDASYQWHASKQHVFSLYGSAIRETAKLDASTQLGLATRQDFALNSYRVTGSYYYDQTYGATLGLFRTTGSRDDTLYAAGALSGSQNNRPNSDGYVLQFDWTPFGKDDSWAGPWVNLRTSLQYVGYTKFNGGTSNYDGNGRNASDNNTLYFLTWMAF